MQKKKKNECNEVDFSRFEKNFISDGIRDILRVHGAKCRRVVVENCMSLFVIVTNMPFTPSQLPPRGFV